MKELRKRKLEYARGLQNDPVKSLEWNVAPVKAKAKTKQQLRDEIVTLTMRNETLEVYHRSYMELLVKEKQAHLKTMRESRNSTIAAYALLVTLVVIVVWEFGI